MMINPKDLSPDTLQALIEAFISREGTDYGDQEFSLSEKVEQVRTQLFNGSAKIVFDSFTETVNVLTKEEADKLYQDHATE